MKGSNRLEEVVAVGSVAIAGLVAGGISAAFAMGAIIKGDYHTASIGMFGTSYLFFLTNTMPLYILNVYRGTKDELENIF